MPKSPLLCTLIAALLFAQNLAARAVVAGVLKNAYLNDRLEIRAPHYYMDGKSSNVVALTDDAGRFKIEVEVPEPQLVFLIHNEDRLVLFVEPTDSVFVSSDVFQFPLAVSLSGRGAQNNRLLHQFLKENPQDFNEFNNLRYKIGYHWTSIETQMDGQMNSLPPAEFKAFLDKRKLEGFALLDDFVEKFGVEVSPACREFLSAEILYDWAFHLLVYANIYKNKHHVETEFFEFLYDAPTSSEQVGSEAYRRFLVTQMAWWQQQKGKTEQIYAEQFQFAGDFLTEKALAFFRSEIIMLAMKSSQFSEILPAYTTFLQTNPHHQFEPKITDLYEKNTRFLTGSPAPDISTVDIVGEPFSLSKLRGKVVYLNFWASWCASCIKKMNYLDEFATELENSGVAIVNISLDEDRERWVSSINEEGFRGAHLLSMPKPDLPSFAKKFNVEAVPQYFLLSKNGTFADRPSSSQPEEIRKRLVELAKSNF